MMSIIKKIMTDSLLLISIIALNCVKISYIVGSHAAGFTFSNCLVPLSGYWSGPVGSALICASLLFYRMARTCWNPFSLLVYHVPGFFASLYFAFNHWVIRILVPLVSMVLFMVHPVGSHAWVYTLPWLVPVSVSLIGARSFFLHALASTFVAHAVGSTLWIYFNPMTASAWIALLPVALIERCSFALGMSMIRSYVNLLKAFFATGTISLSSSIDS